MEKHNNLNFVLRILLMEPLSPQMIGGEMSASTSLGLTIFIGSVIGGFYFMDILRRWKSVESRIDELEHDMHDVTSIQDAHADALQECDQRIREKQDYDSSDDVQHGKYQGWVGIYTAMNRNMQITILREKYSTLQKNQEWVAWDGSANASTVVRDFYLGNSDPDFSWNIIETDTSLLCQVAETLVNGWDSVIKIQITFTLPAKESLLEFTEQEYYNGSPTLNLALKKVIDKKMVEWSRILIDA